MELLILQKEFKFPNDIKNEIESHLTKLYKRDHKKKLFFVLEETNYKMRLPSTCNLLIRILPKHICGICKNKFVAIYSMKMIGCVDCKLCVDIEDYDGYYLGDDGLIYFK